MTLSPHHFSPVSRRLEFQRLSPKVYILSRRTYNPGTHQLNTTLPVFTFRNNLIVFTRRHSLTQVTFSHGSLLHKLESRVCAVSGAS
jgi:hypothetical protein